MQWSTVIMDSFVLHTVLQAAKVATCCHTISLFLSPFKYFKTIVRIVITWLVIWCLLAAITSRSSTCRKYKVGELVISQ